MDTIITRTGVHICDMVSCILRFFKQCGTSSIKQISLMSSYQIISDIMTFYNLYFFSSGIPSWLIVHKSRVKSLKDKSIKSPAFIHPISLSLTFKLRRLMFQVWVLQSLFWDSLDCFCCNTSLSFYVLSVWIEQKHFVPHRP